MFGKKSKKVEFKGKQFYSIDKYLETEDQIVEAHEFWCDPALDNLGEHYGLVERVTEPLESFEKFNKIKYLIRDNLNCKKYHLFSNYHLKKNRIWVEKDCSFFYPDLFIVENEIEYYSNRKDIISNPSMILEITNRFAHSNKRERTAKFWMYQNLPTLMEYVLVTKYGSTLVETYNRTKDNSWKYKIFSKDRNEIVKFESIDIKVPIKNIYL